MLERPRDLLLEIFNSLAYARKGHADTGTWTSQQASVSVLPTAGARVTDFLVRLVLGIDKEDI